MNQHIFQLMKYKQLHFAAGSKFYGENLMMYYLESII